MTTVTLQYQPLIWEFQILREVRTAVVTVVKKKTQSETLTVVHGQPQYKHRGSRTMKQAELFKPQNLEMIFFSY